MDRAEPYPEIPHLPYPDTQHIPFQPQPALDLIEQCLKSTIYDPFHNSESLEFYGDAILKLVASFVVFMNNPEFDEHNLSIKR